MTQQSINLLKEWDATAGDMLNAQYALSSERCFLVGEKFDGVIYSRIHRSSNGSLMLEERAKGSMYPSCWLLTQDFSELESLLNKK